MEHYLELCPNPIRFEPGSKLNNIFFDDSNRQVFAVRSGGATGIVVKGHDNTKPLTFCMEDRGAIQFIKFSPDNQILAIQRDTSSVEFIMFGSGQQPLGETIVYRTKSQQPILNFVWAHTKEVAIFSTGGIDLFQVNGMGSGGGSAKKSGLKVVKSLNLSINRFLWCPLGNFALLSSNEGSVLTPVIIRQGTISKLPRLELNGEKKLIERDITLAVLYGTGAILIRQQTSGRLVELVVYLLNGPGMAPKRCHVLRLGHSGHFVISSLDDLIIVHYQESKTSLIFDIALSGDYDPIDRVHRHKPLTPGKSIRPFQLKLPSISNEGAKLDCELYAESWVLFQPNILIDIEVGCYWTLQLNMTALCSMVSDRVRLTEFLLQRSDGKPVLIKVLQELVTATEYNATNLLTIEQVFDKINAIYQCWANVELHNLMGTPSSSKSAPKNTHSARVLIDQTDMHCHVLQPIQEKSYLGKIIMVYLKSLTKYGIVAQHDFSKMLVVDLINSRQYATLLDLVKCGLIQESKTLAISLLSLSHLHPIIGQVVLDMLSNLGETELILEVLLEQGKVVDALRMAKCQPSADQLSARKYLEAALKTDDPVTFHSVYAYFQQRNTRLRGNPDFLRSEQCETYIKHYQKTFYS